jgi:hypothetical protein
MATAYQTDNGLVLSTAITGVVLESNNIKNWLVMINVGAKAYLFYSSTVQATATTVYNNLLTDLGWTTVKSGTTFGG